MHKEEIRCKRKLRFPDPAGNRLRRPGRADKPTARGKSSKMADYLFVPQSVLGRWSDQGKVSVDGAVLTILGENKAFALTSAVRFIKLEAGDDTAGLLQKVKTTEALKAMGAEHYMDSVLLGESAYQVQQGFLADANALRRAAAVASAAALTAARAVSPGAAPAPATQVHAADWAAQPEKPDAGEQDLLARFLLDNLQ